jgi:hypothetical protein
MNTVIDYVFEVSMKEDESKYLNPLSVQVSSTLVLQS